MASDPECRPCPDCDGVEYVMSYPEDDMVCAACGLINEAHCAYNTSVFQNQTTSRRPAPREKQPRVISDILRVYDGHVADDFHHVLGVYRSGRSRDGKCAVISSQSRLACLQIAVNFNGHGTVEAFSSRHELDPKPVAKAVKRVKDVLLRSRHDVAACRIVEKLHVAMDDDNAKISRSVHDIAAMLKGARGEALAPDKVRGIKFEAIRIYRAFRRTCFPVFVSRNEQIIAAGVVKYVLYHSASRITPPWPKRLVGEVIVDHYGVSQPSIDFVVNFLKQKAPPSVVTTGTGMVG
jgi:hypothetical protein